MKLSERRCSSSPSYHFIRLCLCSIPLVRRVVKACYHTIAHRKVVPALNTARERNVWTWDIHATPQDSLRDTPVTCGVVCSMLEISHIRNSIDYMRNGKRRRQPRMHLRRVQRREPKERYKASYNHIFETHKINTMRDGENENRSQH